MSPLKPACLTGYFFFPTFLPFFRASERPMAIACFLLVTFFPLRPLFSVPLLRLRIADSTSLEAPKQRQLVHRLSPERLSLNGDVSFRRRDFTSGRSVYLLSWARLVK